MKSFSLPVLLLAVILAFSAFNCRIMSKNTDRWIEQLSLASESAEAEDWESAENQLKDSYSDWSSHQTYLHITAEHEAVDGAEAMYRRASAFADAQELSEFQAETEDLRHQIALLSEMEKFSIKNIL